MNRVELLKTGLSEKRFFENYEEYNIFKCYVTDLTLSLKEAHEVLYVRTREDTQKDVVQYKVFAIARDYFSKYSDNKKSTRLDTVIFEKLFGTAWDSNGVFISIDYDRYLPTMRMVHKTLEELAGRRLPVLPI